MSKNRRRHKPRTLQQQAYDRLSSMRAYGQSKYHDKLTGDVKKKVYSYNTFIAYKRTSKYFSRWVKLQHPECKSLKHAKQYIAEWLRYRQARGLSAWTIHLDAAALAKIFQLSKDEIADYNLPKRCREDIRRSRVKTHRDSHFSKTNNADLIAFCRGTGCRRGVLEKLRGQDLWTREQMEETLAQMNQKTDISEADIILRNNLADALTVFPDASHYIHNIRDKGGLSRFSPVIGRDKGAIIDRMRAVGPNDRVWLHVHSAADIHKYRADYAASIYRQYARDISDIPYDRIHQGTGRKYQSGVYNCRIDERRRKLDRSAMERASKALGHNRISIIAGHYLHGL